MQLAYEIGTVLFAILSATQLKNFQRLLIITRRQCSNLEIEKNANCSQIDF